MNKKTSKEERVKNKFNNLQEELDWWKNLSQKGREKHIKKIMDKQRQQRMKSVMANFEKYLKSGKRTY